MDHKIIMKDMEDCVNTDHRKALEGKCSEMVRNGKGWKRISAERMIQVTASSLNRKQEDEKTVFVNY